MSELSAMTQTTLQQFGGEAMQSFTISLSWGIWILVTIWLLLKPNWLNFVTWIALMATSFASVYLAR